MICLSPCAKSSFQLVKDIILQKSEKKIEAVRGKTVPPNPRIGNDFLERNPIVMAKISEGIDKIA